MKKSVFVIGLVFASAMAYSSVPSATVTSFVQNERKVEIVYNLDGDAVVTAEILTNGAPIAAEQCTGMYGDVNRAIAAGNGKRIAWFPEASANGLLVNATARLTVWALDAPPNYCVVDLTTKSNVTYYANAESVPFGVTNDIYKVDRLVLRKIPAKDVQFQMGDSAISGATVHRVTFTNDYYLGIYPMTIGQCDIVWKLQSNLNFWPKFMNSEQSWMHPVENCNIGIIRGTRDPSTHKMGKGTNWGILLRVTEFTGVLLDIPTEQQWEYACRAGCGATYYYDNITAENLNAYAWYGEANGSTHVVGLKRPNAWGLYDMLGNVKERCVDWYVTGNNYSDGSDVVESYGYTKGIDPQSGNEKSVRGGAYNSTAADLACAKRDKYWTNEQGGGVYGFRVWAPPVAYVKK